LSEVVENREIYITSFNQLVEVIWERNDIINNSLDVMGPQIAKEVEDVKLSVKADQDALGPKLQSSNNIAVIIIVGVSFFALIIAVLISMFTIKSIITQLGEDPSVIDEIASRVSLGDIDMNMERSQQSKGVFLSIERMIESLKYKSELLEQISEGDLTAEVQLASEKDKLGISLTKMLENLKVKAAVVEHFARQNFAAEVKLASDKDGLGKSLIKMKNSLNQVLLQVNTSSDQVSSGSEQVASSSQSLSQGATEQAASLEEITSSITQIAGQTKQNADNAVQANSLSKTSMENAEKGNEQMNQLVNAMSKINTSSDEIKKIVKTIDDIAFQINLLALNANVEAARAGKYGKGFAVVAEEVRNLAVRSAGAVKNTTEMVEESIRNIENGNQLVEMTATQLKEIVDGAAKVADLVEEITSASKEQTSGLEQINESLVQIEQITQSNTAAAEEGASAAEELASMAVQLKEMISSFQLEKVDSFRMNNQLKFDTNEIHQAEYQASVKPTNGNNGSDRVPAGTEEIEVQEKKVIPKEVIALNDDEFGEF
ncbi:MAG: methyl-accepting chemotaxis protein, partial [Spirochaetes bacterium]|nr:methyl-accepting chemotaxis protein [Spirochaetota bacterium]